MSEEEAAALIAATTEYKGVVESLLQKQMEQLAEVFPDGLPFSDLK